MRKPWRWNKAIAKLMMGDDVAGRRGCLDLCAHCPHKDPEDMWRGIRNAPDGGKQRFVTQRPFGVQAEKPHEFKLFRSASRLHSANPELATGCIEFEVSGANDVGLMRQSVEGRFGRIGAAQNEAGEPATAGIAREERELLFAKLAAQQEEIDGAQFKTSDRFREGGRSGDDIQMRAFKKALCRIALEGALASHQQQIHPMTAPRSPSGP